MTPAELRQRVGEATKGPWSDARNADGYSQVDQLTIGDTYGCGAITRDEDAALIALAPDLAPAFSLLALWIIVVEKPQ